ncbi:MAG: sterol desaturase family protein [Chitinophagales bacterium]
MHLEIMQSERTVEIIGLALAGTFVLCILLEFLISSVTKRNYVSSHYLIINLITASLQQITDIVNKGLFLTAFVYVQTHWSVQQLLGIRPIDNSSPVRIVINYLLVLLVADFCQYWLHRLSHEVNIMWASHITHHSNEEYNLSVAVRQNALEGIYTWVFFMPLAFIGISWQLFVFAYSISLLWQFLVHTRYINRLGFLEHFMATPSHHRVHHGRNAQYIDKNYGAFLIVWDKLFGTFEPEVETVDYGITKPLSTNNPIWNNVHHHLSILRSLKQHNTFKHKLKVLFGKPEFASRFDASISEAPSITPQGAKKAYVAINFVITVIVGLWALNHPYVHNNTFVYCIVAGTLLIHFSIYVGLLEQQRWADKLEIIRLFLLLGAGFIYAVNTNTLAGLTVVAISVLCLLTTLLIARNYRRHYSFG